MSGLFLLVFTVLCTSLLFCWWPLPTVPWTLDEKDLFYESEVKYHGCYEVFLVMLFKNKQNTLLRVEWNCKGLHGRFGK